jgi:hypothetical protein
MTHDELLASIEQMMNHDAIFMKDALRAVVELHRPDPKNENYCEAENEWTSWNSYPCETIQAIEKKLR